MRLGLCVCPLLLPCSHSFPLFFVFSSLGIFHLWQRLSPTQLTCVIWKISWHDAAKSQREESRGRKEPKETEKEREREPERHKVAAASKAPLEKHFSIWFFLFFSPFLFQLQRPRTKNSWLSDLQKRKTWFLGAICQLVTGWEHAAYTQRSARSHINLHVKMGKLVRTLTRIRSNEKSDK